MLGSGMNDRSVCAAGSMRDCGTVIAGERRPGQGIDHDCARAEKSPARAASVGTVEYESTGVRE